MTILGTRWTPREWTGRLAERLAHAPHVTNAGAAGSLRLALRYGGRGPFSIDVRDAYEAYQRAHTDNSGILDATATSILSSLARMDEEPTWEEARGTLLPWLLHIEEAGEYATRGTIGGMAIAFIAALPVTGDRIFVTPPAWGVAPAVLMHRALENLQCATRPPSFVPLPDAPDVLRLAPADRLTASRVLLPTVRRAIFARVGSPAVLWIAARDAVFICAPTVLGDPPSWLATVPAIRDALAGPDVLSERPILIHSGSLVSHERD